MKKYYCKDCIGYVHDGERCHKRRFIVRRFHIAMETRKFLVLKKLEKRCTGFELRKVLNGEDIRKKRGKKKNKGNYRVVNISG